MAFRVALLVALLAAAVPASRPAASQEQPAGTGSAAPTDPAATVRLRTGDHPGFGRVVFDLPGGVTYSVAAENDRVVVRFTARSGTVAVAPGARAPRNVQSIMVRGSQVEIALAPGARPRNGRLGDRIVLDVADPPSPSQATTAVPTAVQAAAPEVPQAPLSTHSKPAARPHAARPTPARVEPISGGTPDSRHRAAEAAQSLLRGTPDPPATASTEGLRGTGLGIAAIPTPVAATALAGDGSRSITLPFGPAVGAAAMRRGDVAVVVFDDRRPVDMAQLRTDPFFGAASITVLPTATVLRLPLFPDQHLRLGRVEGGWTVSIHASETALPALRPIRPELADGRLRLSADAPGQVVSVPDPLTGISLLVGTQRADGQAVPIDRRTPEFALIPTWLGVAVIPLSDALTLRPNARGFVLAADGDRALALSAPESQTLAMTEAARASRRFDLPALPTDALHRRLQLATLAAASAPPQARTARRRDVAEAMLALGMGAEMQAVMALAVAEDARAADDPDIIGLAAIAALLAGRGDEAAAIEDSRLTGTDEIALWRAVRAAQRDEGAPRSAAVFASAMPLLLSYPAALRDRLLILALETMALGGERENAAGVLDRLAGQAGLDLARGFAAERAGGDPAAALAFYDRVAATPDRRARARAARQAVELRLANGLTTPPQAADALERLAYAWRGDQQEVDLRIRIAELRAQAGAWRGAMALLRETRELFPQHDDVLRSRLVAILTRSLASEAESPLPPLDLVALAEENADLLPEGDAGQALAARLAERLMALELPQRAVAMLEKLVADVPAGAARAALGGKLASLRLQQGDGQGALAALSATVVEGPLPLPLLESRTLAFARASAGNGALSSAVAALRDLGTPAAHELRATLLEEIKDWPGATAALAAYAAATLPATGTLDAAQGRLALRLASAAAQAGDEVMLARLRDQQASRIPEGQVRDLFHLLTATPVQGVADLPRAAQEMKLARGATGSLKALSAPR